MAKRILLVEDSTDTRLMERTMLEQFGYEVDEARDGYEAIEKAKANPPDLILMDVAMPHLDGFKATRILQTSPVLANIPVIAITAYRNFTEKAIESGCAAIVYKPLDIVELKHVVDSFLT